VDDDFCGVSVRSATVGGYSPRLRLDLTINILTQHALTRGEIRVFGGSQERPNIHVRDLADFYVRLIDAPREIVSGQAFNVTRENSTVLDLALMVRREIDPELPIRTVPTDDNRSYRLSGEKVARALGYRPPTPLVAAVRDLRRAFAAGLVADPADPVYRNVELMRRRLDFRFYSPAA
jgi:nucleoside-diphosphate-sugar epimerase